MKERLTVTTCRGTVRAFPSEQYEWSFRPGVSLEVWGKDRKGTFVFPWTSIEHTLLESE